MLPPQQSEIACGTAVGFGQYGPRDDSSDGNASPEGNDDAATFPASVSVYHQTGNPAKLDASCPCNVSGPFQVFEVPEPLAIAFGTLPGMAFTYDGCGLGRSRLKDI